MKELKRTWRENLKEDKSNGMFFNLILVWISSWIKYPRFWDYDSNNKRALFQILEPGLSIRDREV